MPVHLLIYVRGKIILSQFRLLRDTLIHCGHNSSSLVVYHFTDSAVFWKTEDHSAIEYSYFQVI